VHVEAADVGVAQNAVEPIGDQSLGALAPAAAAERGDRLPELLACGCQQRPEFVTIDAEQACHLGARPVGQRHERERTRLERRKRGQHGGHLTYRSSRVHRTGGAGGHGSQGRVLHEPAQ
jgi:hypothetical protein